MNPDVLRVALGQINPRSGDIRGNVTKILDYTRQAIDLGCQLVAFPEMAVPGYCLDEKLLINQKFMRENKQAVFDAIAPASKDIAIITGFLDFDAGSLGPDETWLRYNAAAICLNGQCEQIVHKTLLPNYRYFDDKRYFTPGHPGRPFALRVGPAQFQTGVAICEDLWDENYPIKPTASLAEQGSQFIVCINASPYVCASPGKLDGKRFRRRQLVTDRVQRYGVAVAYVNTVGVGDNGKNIIPFDGGSFTMDARGRLIQTSSQFKEELGIAELSAADGSGQPIDEPPFHREAEMYDALCMGVRDYFEKVPIFKGVLQSLSGGIDSALGTCIAVDAVGKDRVFAMSLPSRHNSEATQEAASALAARLGIGYRILPIQPIVDRILEAYRETFGEFTESAAIENIQARVRGVLLMARSNDRSELLISNGNETEIATGYSTLYGDMCGGIAVLGDLSKLDVYRLARYVNDRAATELIPQASLTMAPSAELAPGQTDPFDYSIVSPLIGEFIEHQCTIENLVETFERRALDETRFPPDDQGKTVYDRYAVASFRAIVERTYRQMTRSVYKRLQGPPIIVISERAFGFDLRETLLNFWQE